MQYINESIEMFTEDIDDEVLRSAEIIPKRDNNGAGIDKLVTSYDGKTCMQGIVFDEIARFKT